MLDSNKPPFVTKPALLDFFSEYEPRSLLDISPHVSLRTAVFPGDIPFEQNISMDFSKGNHLKLSSLSSTVHLGAHADAPSHYHSKGADIADVSLRPYVGLCQVAHAQVKRGERINKKNLGGDFAFLAKRLLVRSDTFPDPENWNSDFASFDPEFISEFAEWGGVLIGIDTPSVDPEQSKDLPSHQVLARTGLSVLEGLVLTQAPLGLCFLMALPLPLEGFDASPVRAVLVLS